jgi:lysophospholipase L1-like esterase
MIKSTKNLFKYCLFVSVAVVLPCLTLEIGLRLEHWYRSNIPLSTNPRDRWDSTLGWLGKEHRIGAEDASPILVLGDSFTDGLGVASAEMWFSSLRERFPQTPIIAYGGMGYGTLQELMVLKNYKAAGVVPSKIILQLCSNDIINNYYLLERESYLQRAPGPRPYLENGDITIRFPRANGWILFPIISISHLAHHYSVQWDTKLALDAQNHKITTVEYVIQRQGFSYPPFRQAVATTSELLTQFKKEAGDIPVIFMLVDDNEPYSAALKGISRNLKVPLFIPQHNNLIPSTGRLADGVHLNEVGNKVLGQTFVRQGSERSVF